MDSSIDENNANNISSQGSFALMQIIINRVRSFFGFFTMSKEEMDQAGIDRGESSVSHSQSAEEDQPDSPAAQNSRRVV